MEIKFIPHETKMKILNLYAGIGGNRKLWGNEHKITAVERDKTIAKTYQCFFPNDLVITSNAHKFLLQHYQEYDFIWSSPPCPTHSTMRNLKNNCEETIKKYPNMMLYEEILFLKHFFKGKWVVENVISWYEPLINPQMSNNHYFWCNFIIPHEKKDERQIRGNIPNSMEYKMKRNGFDLTNIKVPKRLKEKMLNNCVKPEVGLSIFESAFKIKQQTLNDHDGGINFTQNPCEDSALTSPLITAKFNKILSGFYSRLKIKDFGRVPIGRT